LAKVIGDYPKKGQPFVFNAAEKRSALSERTGTVLPERPKEFLGHCAFLSARERGHGRFRALFAGTFGLRWKMVELRPKTKK
jgi:hypothetical protein